MSKEYNFKVISNDTSKIGYKNDTGYVSYIDKDGLRVDFIQNDYESISFYVTLDDFKETLSIDENDLKKIIEKQEELKKQEPQEQDDRIPDLPSSGNQIFGGWYTDPEFKNRIYTLSKEEINSSTHIELYPKWIDVN